LQKDIASGGPKFEIVTLRVFNASRDLLYDAWTDPQRLKNWWGPAGFTNTFNTFDLRVGGIWDFVMHGPEKGHYHNLCEFIHVDKPALLAWQRHSKPIFKVVVVFEAITPQQTKVQFKMIFDTVEECNKLRPYVTDKNEENLDRLEVELRKMQL
jgi:hypothetical protein